MASLIHPSGLLAPLLIGWTLVACTGSPDAPRTGPSDSPSPETSSPPTGAVEAPDLVVDTWTGAWHDVTDVALGPTANYTNRLEAADIDTDGDVDLLFANGGDYDEPGTPVANAVFLNDGTGGFTDASTEVFGDAVGITRVIKVADVNTDSVPDIVVGTTYQTQSRLYLGDGDGGWRDATATNLPSRRLSVGDLELGDVDTDGDLDLVLADWGPGSPMHNQGGAVALWLNDGSGRFTDATGARMPPAMIGFSWDLELVDTDNDWDLDIAVSCKMCPTSRLYENDGRGRFTDVTADGMPHFTNNYDFTALDLDADGYLDLVTVNDGEDTGLGLAEHVFRNGSGRGYVDATDEWCPAGIGQANAGWDDAVETALDVESDGDVDFLVASLDGPDRILVNDGSGALTVSNSVFDGTPTRGTLDFAVADLNGDRRLDVVEAQGEVEGYEDERVYLATELVPPDTAPPVIRAELADGQVLARVHDNRTPNLPHDWRSIVVRSSGSDVPMDWYGENLFRAEVPAAAGGLQVCATDAAGNEACAPVSSS
jgi:hypothetical protein